MTDFGTQSGVITFTQYLRPDGRREEVWIERPLVIKDKADTIVSAGLRFECEVLLNGLISLTITDDEDDQAMELLYFF